MDMARNIHQRMLILRDAALGSRNTVAVNSTLASASYDCAVDSLLALHVECSKGNLTRDKNIARFLYKHEGTVSALKELRLSADDFEVKSIIGRGHFGEVRVVRERSTGDVFALKVMKKAHILQQADAAFFTEERDIMAWTTSPWLTSLHYAFQDPESLYLVMDFHPGGDLLTVMERHEGGMKEEDARFYLAEIAAALNDLHQLGFVHRDVKPDNVLITLSGHIKLVDFGSAARLGVDGKVLEPRLPVGTPEYIAPEVLTSLDSAADYGVCCDWWSLGIIAYELLFEVTPFEGKSTTHTYGNIMNFKKSLKFPADIEASGEVKNLIRKLLTDRCYRLEFEGIKCHVFFTNINWNDLGSVLPPYIPSVTGPDDTSNFDVLEPQKEEHLRDFLSRDRGESSGKTLPFVGFTFTRYSSSPGSTETSSSVSVDASVVQELQKALESTRRELSDMKDRKESFERECVIYQSQLEDYHRKLEIEISERRNSDSKALELLAEVREQGRIAQELRESEAKLTQGEVNSVLEQLEQDRIVASKRARRLQEDLYKTQQDYGQAMRMVSELKTKLADVKKNSSKDVAALQSKLAKVTKDSLAKEADMQDRLMEAHGRFAETSKKLKTAESSCRKLEFELQQARTRGSPYPCPRLSPLSKESLVKILESAHLKFTEIYEGFDIKEHVLAILQESEKTDTLSKKYRSRCLLKLGADNESAKDAMKKLLETTQEACENAERTVSELEEKVEAQSRETEALQTQNNDLNMLVKDLEGQLEEASSRNQQLETSECNMNKQLKELELEVSQLRQDREQLETDCKKIQTDLNSKTQLLNTQEETIGKLTSDQQSLEAKLAEMERLKAAADESSAEESVKTLSKRIGELEGEKQHLSGTVSSLQTQLAAKAAALEEVETQMEELKAKGKEDDSRMREEVRSLQKKVSEVMNMVIQQGEKMREVRRAKRETDQENMTLRTSLTKAELVAHSCEERYQEVMKELQALKKVKKKLGNLEEEIGSLYNTNKDMNSEVEEAQQVKEEAVAAQRAAEGALRDTKKQVEAQELSIALFQRKVKSLEDELAEAKSSMEESRVKEAQWRSIKEKVMGDLEMAEGRLDSAFAAAEKEKQLRLAAEQHVTEVLSTLEKAAAAHSDEIQCLRQQLVTQKQLASKYSDKVSDLEREVKLKQLSLKDLQKELDTEKALTSKLYDDLHSLGREHGKTKASHQKLLSESQERETQLTQVAEARERLLMERQNVAQAHHVQQTRMQATIAQQSKLIDYLQGTPNSRLKIKKGFKLRRKSRDPAKEIAEWYKIKGLVSKPKDVTGVVAQSSTPSVSLQHVAHTSSKQPLSGSSSMQSIRELATSPLTSQPSSSFSRSLFVVVPTITSTGIPIMKSYVSTTSPEAPAPWPIPPSIHSSSFPGGRQTSYVNMSPPGVPVPWPMSSSASCSSFPGGRQKSPEAPTWPTPPNSGSSSSFPGVTQYFSVATQEEEREQPVKSTARTSAAVNGPLTTTNNSAQRGTKKCSVKVMKCPAENAAKISPPKVAGRKRTHDEVTLEASSTSTSEASCVTAEDKKKTMEHNIPHKFSLKSTPLYKSYTCAVCHTAIKHLEKLAKCQYCATICHPKCIDSLPNNCCLPPELASHVNSDQLSLAKKVRTQINQEPLSESEEASSGSGHSSSESEREKGGKGKGKRFGRRKEKKNKEDIIKTEKVYVPKGDISAEGWLVLTEASLCLYDREPKRITRKPVSSFHFDNPGLTFAVLPSVEERLSPPSASSSGQLPLTFGIEQRSIRRTERATFIAKDVQSRTEWMEAIEGVLSNYSRTIQVPETVAKPQTRELKSVSVIPIKTTQIVSPKKENLEEETLDFSITSSMLESPTSVSDV